MKRAIIIIVYFGKLPKMFPLFIESCKNNSNYNWLIFTDQTCEAMPSNVQIVQSSLPEIEKLVQDKIADDLHIERPYKLCDYKVAYGLLFEDYIAEYDYWGYGDLDVIYGTLDNFLKSPMDDDYDKIYTLGHLCLYKNTTVINRLFMDRENKKDNIRDCIEIMRSNKNGAYDEQHGINELMLEKGYKVYLQIDAMDMGMYYDRIMCAAKQDMIYALGADQPSIQYSKENYKYQAFYYKDGKVFRVFYDKKQSKMINEEFAYLHYRLKNYEMPKDNNDAFWITMSGFVNDEQLKTDPCNWITKDDIRRLNSNGSISETIRHYIFNKKIYGWK